MSQEIQLVNQNLPLQPALGPTVLAPAAQTEPTPLRRMHRLLRGRYGLAMFLAAIGAACGTVAGIMIPKPAWSSTATIQIHPLIPLRGTSDMVMPLWAQYVQNVMVKLHTERVIKQAMQNPEWRMHRNYTGDYPPPEQIAQFSKNLTVKQTFNAPEMIEVSYQDTQPDARDVAQPAVKAVIDAYIEIFGKHDMAVVDTKMEVANRTKDELTREIAANQQSILALTKEVGDDSTAVLTAQEQALLALRANLREMKKVLANAQKDLERRRQGLEGSQNYTPEEIASVDITMADRLRGYHEAQIALEQLMAMNLGQNHPDVRRQKLLVEVRASDVQKAAMDFNDRWFIQTRTDGSTIKVPKDLKQLKAAVDELQTEADRQAAEIKDVNSRHGQIVELKAQNDEKHAQLNELTKLVSDLQFEKDMGSQFNLIEPGTLPQPASDRRPVFAALGFLGGAALPIGFLLLLGLANPRYRFSDETNTDTTGLNLLGILPDLPDRLSDPEQASIAAHCVHQIRTMLQISGGTEERRVFAVTSAAPGDGKTSLTLALGLSYAACGTRTLLIDCDLVGAGLTARMNVNSPDGVLEAIANRSLPEYVRNTDVADVSILPVGAAQTLHASTLSPAALRRLIDEARKQYDTILIDTGPILGSIEASLVCAAADAVVLTVARGQQRPLVEKAINHLASIGAKLAGVVFNRAQANDFDRSISGVSSLRSVSSGNGHNGHDGPRYGTLGRAVHSNSRTSEINEG